MRVKYIRTTPELLVEVMKHGTAGVRPVANHLPSDARFIRAGLDPVGGLNLVLESSEWPEVREGEVMVELPPVLMERVK